MSQKTDNNSLPYGRQWVNSADVDSVMASLAAPFLTTGPVVAGFEAELCRLTGARHSIACVNGTAALHLACMALGVDHGDWGLTSPNSFLASANCVEFCGGQVDFIDIDSDTLCLSSEKLEDYLKGKRVPKVVIPVSFAGVPADLPAIKALSDKYGFAVIEDAAHSLGSDYRVDGQVFASGSCAHSDLAIFSFHPVKNITTGEGGAVMTNDDKLACRLRSLRNHATEKSESVMEMEGPWYYEMQELAYNYRITEFQCALGMSQLVRLSEFKRRRQEIATAYNTAFKENFDLILLPVTLCDACPHLYPIQFKRGSRIRKLMYQELKKVNIHCQVHYIPIYWQPYYAKKYGYEKGKCPNAETYYSRCLSLPLFPAMTDHDVERVIGAVLNSVVKC